MTRAMPPRDFLPVERPKWPGRQPPRLHSWLITPKHGPTSRLHKVALAQKMALEGHWSHPQSKGRPGGLRTWRGTPHPGLGLRRAPWT